jgi:TetR/AcrR family transcriptional regulator, regulator of cefoperazone and chloramphenicol sensitivity
MTIPDPEPSSRTRLLEAAILAFSEKGFDATGIREISAKAKANSALVNYHFGGKTGLYAEALRHIFSCKTPAVPDPPASASEADARPRAIRVLGEMIENLLAELLACSDGSELERASLLLVTREMQDPREDVADLILEHMRPYTEHLLGCIAILRPDLDRSGLLDASERIFGQVVHLHTNLRLIRLIRNEPDYPRDLQAVARHITEFSLRGLSVPEAFPGA